MKLFNGFTTGGQQYRELVELWQQFTNEKSPLPHSYREYVDSGYKAASPVFACVLVRMQLVSQARWYWRDYYTHERIPPIPQRDGLDLLRNPWPNGSASDLNARMEQDGSLAGNAFVYRARPSRLQRLRPDWIEFIIQPDRTDPKVYEHIGYLYTPGGYASGERQRSKVLFTEEVAHYAPVPDPMHPVRGMSWLTPIARQINNTVDMSDFQSSFFNNAATPNLLIKVAGKLQPDQRDRLEEVVRRRHTGPDNAYKTMLLEGGADATVVGSDLRQVQFAMTKAANDNDIATAAGVPAILAGLKEGLQSATYSNAAQARRVFAMGTGRFLLEQTAEALASILPKPTPTAELWYDERKMAWMQEDAMEAAQILAAKAGTMSSLINAGYNQDQVAAAVESGDLSALDHTGLFSVQLQPANTPTREPQP